MAQNFQEASWRATERWRGGPAAAERDERPQHQSCRCTCFTPGLPQSGRRCTQRAANDHHHRRNWTGSFALYRNVTAEVVASATSGDAVLEDGSAVAPELDSGTAPHAWSDRFWCPARPDRDGALLLRAGQRRAAAVSTTRYGAAFDPSQRCERTGAGCRRHWAGSLAGGLRFQRGVTSTWVLTREPARAAHLARCTRGGDGGRDPGSLPPAAVTSTDVVVSAVHGFTGPDGRRRLRRQQRQRPPDRGRRAARG